LNPNLARIDYSYRSGQDHARRKKKSTNRMIDAQEMARTNNFSDMDWLLLHNCRGFDNENITLHQLREEVLQA
jgi:hypothetical protein